MLTDTANLTPTVRTIRRGPWLQLGGMRRYALTHVTLPLPTLSPDLHGLRILHLGDTHLKARHWDAGLDAAIAEAAELRPDLICHTGDWIDDKFDFRPALPNLKRFVEGLMPSARLGLWSCIGNHDGDLLAPRLIDLGVRVLLGETARFATAEGALELVGLPGVARDDLTEEVVAGLAPKQPDTTRIALCHFPDAIAKLTTVEADLQLAGHTHGGQICLPWGTPIVTHDTLGKHRSAGLHRVGDTWLHITRGLGWTGLPIRFLAPPAMTLIELVRAGDQ